MKEFRKLKNNVLEITDTDKNYVSTHTYNDLLGHLVASTTLEKLAVAEENLAQAKLLGITQINYTEYFIPSIGEWATLNDI